MAPTLLLVGGGKMGSALLSGLVAAGWAPVGDLAVSETDPAQRARLAEAHPGLTVVDGPSEAADILLAVKPDVAEAVLRTANVPVCIVGPNVVEGTYRNRVSRKILCDVSKQEASKVVANFGAELAAEHNAGLILQQVIPPQARAEILADRTIHQIEAELPTLVPAKLQRKIRVQTRVTLGDPTEELLYQGRTQQANLIVLGAHGASHFAAITRAGTVYKVLAYAHCPVITMSPIVLAECGAREDKPRLSEVNYMAGVF